MKKLASLLLLSTSLYAQGKPVSVTGLWQGSALVKNQQVPITVELSGSGPNLKAALHNGPETSAASTATLTGDHLVLAFNYFARTLDATVVGDTLTGTFDITTAKLPLTLHRASMQRETPIPSALSGDWEIAVHSPKGESAWQLRITGQHAVIQRIDGDTGSLYGHYDAASNAVLFSHFTAAGPALYRVKPQGKGTLLVDNLLSDTQHDLVARRPAEARKEQLAAPTDPTQQTTLKDPAAPLTFSAPTLSGKVVSSSDPEFRGKVVLVAVGGSWCPNCHDEAPLLESLYTRYHARGLDIVDLSFEEADQLKDPARLRAFVARYGITYPVLLAGVPDQLNEKITIANNLNCWPTSFFVGRDGRVKEIHAGFAGPANPPAHDQLEKQITALVEQLLAEPALSQSAAR